MKDIFNTVQGTIIVEEIIAPRLQAERTVDFLTNVLGEEVSLDDFEFPTVQRWNDIAFFQYQMAINGIPPGTQGQGGGAYGNIATVVQYHVSV